MPVKKLDCFNNFLLGQTSFMEMSICEIFRIQSNILHICLSYITKHASQQGNSFRAWPIQFFLLVAGINSYVNHLVHTMVSGASMKVIDIIYYKDLSI